MFLAGDCNDWDTNPGSRARKPSTLPVSYPCYPWLIQFAFTDGRCQGLPPVSITPLWCYRRASHAHNVCSSGDTIRVLATYPTRFPPYESLFRAIATNYERHVFIALLADLAILFNIPSKSEVVEDLEIM